MNNNKIELNPTQTVLVIGGYGFIGSRVVEHLESLGAHVLIGTRGKRLNHDAGTKKILLHKAKTEYQWLEILQDIDVVVNAAGILRQRWGETYDQVHHQALKLIAGACAHKNIRLVHLSALGLENPIKSRFLSSKLDGEAALRESGADWRIVRPSLVDGDGGYGASWFRRVARWKVYFAPANATHHIAPIDVDDLGLAIAKIALRHESKLDDEGRIYELGGPDKLIVFEYLDRLNPTPPIARLRIPSIFARLISHLFDVLYFSPYSFGHYELLKFPNIPNPNRLEELLGNPAKQLGERNLGASDKRPCNESDYLESLTRVKI